MLAVSNAYLLSKGISSAGRFVWREGLLLPLMAFGCSWPRKDASLDFSLPFYQEKGKSLSGGEEERTHLSWPDGPLSFDTKRNKPSLSRAH